MSVIVNQLRAVGVYNRLSLPTYTTDLGKLNNISQTVVPSLQLDFTQERLDPRITFTRASSATRTNAQGLIETTPVNLLTYSQDFDNAAWTKSNATVTANATTAPDGTSTADMVVFSDGSSEIKQAYTVTSGTSRTFSIYVKGTAGETVMIGHSSGTAVSPVVLTGSWQRFTVTDTIGVNAFIGTWSGSTARTIYIWGAQLEQSSQASTYIPTTSSISGAPRFDYDPVTLQPKGLLIEEQRTNLLSASQDFEAPVWVKSNATVHANCVVAPDGTLTADKLVEDSAANLEHRLRVVSISKSANAVLTYSVYVKPAGRYFILSMEYSGLGLYTTFDVSTNQYWDYAADAGWTRGQSSIIAVGNGWYRCSISGTSDTSTTINVRVNLTNAQGTQRNTLYTGDGTSGIYIWGAQLEAGAFATSYVPTPITFTSRASTATYRGTNGLIQTAAINTARYEPNSSGGSNLLLESAATNLLTYSEQFDNAAWTKTGVTVTADNTTSPDGGLTADLVTQDTSNGSHRVLSSSMVGAGTGTMSYFLKYKSTQWVQLFLYDTASGQYRWANFDLVNGVVGFSGGSSTASIVPAGNGWYRCIVSGAIGASGGSCQVFLLQGNTNSFGPTYTGDGTSGIYIWGAQLETGAVATSYIPTTTAQVTRAADVYSAPTVTRSADVASMTGTNFSSWYRQDEGTYYVSFDTASVADATLVAGDTVGSPSLGVYNGFLSYGQSNVWSQNGGAIAANSNTATSFGYKSSQYATCVNGGSVASNSNSGIPALPTYLRIASNTTNNRYINGHIKRIAYYPKRLSNTELQGITA